MKEKESIRIALVGTHSTGKTVLAKSIAEEYKLKLISGLARDCQKKGLKLNKAHNNEFSSDNLQKELMKKHEDILVNSMVKQINIIQDRSLFDVMAYSFCFHNNNQINDTTLSENFNILCKYHTRYTYLIYLPLTEKTKIVDDGIRDKNNKFQKEINLYIRSLLRLFKGHINYFYPKQENFNLRKKEVFKFLDKKLK